jgi:LmbE family N-acetylglucosaminyl deacetylase
VARNLARKLLEARAGDLSATIGARSCLVVAPHPDDETLGCGATIARKARSGSTVTVVVVSDGSRSHTGGGISPEQLAAIRRAEAERAVRRLGPGVRLEFLNFPDGELDRHRDALTERLRTYVADLRPQDVFSPALREPPADHRAVAIAVRAACAGHPASRVLEYPVWLWSSWPWTGRRSPHRLLLDPIRSTLFTPTVKVSTAGYLDAKASALAAYASQVTYFRGDPGWLPLPAQLLDRCLRPAEVFFPVG